MCRATVAILLMALTTTGLTLLTATSASATVVPSTPHFSAAIEQLSGYQPQKKCRPSAKPGVLEFRALVLRTYSGTGDSGIVRACSSGGTSEHKEGRAWDWTVSIHNAHQVKQVHALFHWLFKKDAYGNRYAMARRLGIMYIIWDKHIWGSYSASAGWRHYSCSGVTDCHQNHVHFSFDWAGAKGLTSFWTHDVATGGNGGGAGDGTGGGPGGGGDWGSGGGSGGGGHGDHHGPGDAASFPLHLTVSARADGVRSSALLRAGHAYVVHARGTYRYWSSDDGWERDTDTTGLRADAECMQGFGGPYGTDAPPTWSSTSPYSHDEYDGSYDLWVSGHTDWTPVHDSGGGCNLVDHRYVMRITPTSTIPVAAVILDWRRDNNAGRLHLTVKRARHA